LLIEGRKSIRPPSRRALGKIKRLEDFHVRGFAQGQCLGGTACAVLHAGLGEDPQEVYFEARKFGHLDHAVMIIGTQPTDQVRFQLLHGQGRVLEHLGEAYLHGLAIEIEGLGTGNNDEGGEFPAGDDEDVALGADCADLGIGEAGDLAARIMALGEEEVIVAVLEGCSHCSAFSLSLYVKNEQQGRNSVSFFNGFFAMGKDFHLVMASRSKEQLLAVLRESYDYEPEAVEAAHDELRRRGVNGFDIAAAEDEAEVRALEQDACERVPLSKRETLVWLLLPFLALTPWGPLQLLRYGRFGHRRKAIQAMECVVIGLSGYLLGGLVILG
jgi:hypothetical protein